jgi:hypothetical protein
MQLHQLKRRERERERKREGEKGRERKRERERERKRERERAVSVCGLPQSVVRLEVGACTDQPKSAILMSP